MRQILAFLGSLTGPAWICFAVASAGLLSSLYAWLPLSSHPARLPLYLLLAAMGAGLLAFASMAGHHLITWEHRKQPQPKIRLPRGFWIAAFAALAYFLAVFLGAFAIYPHGVDLDPLIKLRIASAAALFFGTSALGFTQWAGLRARALQAAT
ncbi:MAG: hypothetical protein QM719_11245 [Thermomonas sp.]